MDPHARWGQQGSGCYLGHDVLQLAAGLVGAIIIAEAVHHRLVLELVLVGDWRDPAEVRPEGKSWALPIL